MRITGVIYTARDAAHGRLLPLIDEGKPLPIDVQRPDHLLHRARRRARPGDVVGLHRAHHRRAAWTSSHRS